MASEVLEVPGVGIENVINQIEKDVHAKVVGKANFAETLVIEATVGRWQIREAETIIEVTAVQLGEITVFV